MVTALELAASLKSNRKTNFLLVAETAREGNGRGKGNLASQAQQSLLVE